MQGSLRMSRSDSMMDGSSQCSGLIDGFLRRADRIRECELENMFDI